MNKSELKRHIIEALTPQEADKVDSKYKEIYGGMLKGNKRKLMKYIDPESGRPNPDKVAYGRAIKLIQKESANLKEDTRKAIEVIKDKWFPIFDKNGIKLKKYEIGLSRGENMEAGDEIAVYDTRGLLVGAMPFENDHIVIPVYGNDELSQVKDGLNNGEVFSLSIWSNKNNSEHQIATDFSKEAHVFEKDDIVY